MKAPTVALCLLVVAGLAYAQQPSPSPAPSEIGTMPAAGGYTYNPQGRRDPFVSLQKPVAADQGSKTRRAGLEGFMIQEVALKGIVKTLKGHVALLLGTDGKTYFARIGQRLYDGTVTSINASSVTFRQEVTDPLSTVKSRDVTKTLYPSEEATQ